MNNDGYNMFYSRAKKEDDRFCFAKSRSFIVHKILALKEYEHTTHYRLN